MDATEGATILFRVATESATIATIKDTAAKVANAVQTTAASIATKAWAASTVAPQRGDVREPDRHHHRGRHAPDRARSCSIATKTTWFQDIWAAAWGAIKTASAAVWSWLENTASTVLEGILWPIEQVKKAFDKIVDAIESVISWIGKIKLPKAVSDVIDKIGSILPFSSGSGGSSASTAPTVSAQAMGRTGLGGGSTTINLLVPESSDPVATSRYLKALIRRGEAAGVQFGTT